MSGQGGAGGAFRHFSGSLSACIRKRLRNSVFAHPAHPSAGVGSLPPTEAMVCGTYHPPAGRPTTP